jgi:3-methylfumaryl-CoA hydratase
MTDRIERTELITPGPALALADLLGVGAPNVDDGLPPLWHLVYLLGWPAQATLGPDGHPTSGVIPVPPGPGLRRMFAGGRVQVTGAFRPGEYATRRTFVESQTEKQGRTGPLTFVTVAQEIVQRDIVVIAEQQDIVYRGFVAAESPSAAPTAE